LDPIDDLCHPARFLPAPDSIPSRLLARAESVLAEAEAEEEVSDRILITILPPAGTICLCEELKMRYDPTYEPIEIVIFFAAAACI